MGAGLVATAKHLHGEEDLHSASLQDFCEGGLVAMPIRRRATDAGILQPAELDLLARVFEQLRVAGQSQEAREAIASRIIANYMVGVTDEAELVSLSRQPLGR